MAGRRTRHLHKAGALLQAQTQANQVVRPTIPATQQSQLEILNQEKRLIPAVA